MHCADSELIIHPNGSIYHLHLRPEHLADTVLLVGDPDRVAVVSRFFDSVDVKIQHREFVTHAGSLNGRRICCISTGIGTDNIDIVLNELDALVHFDLTTRQPLAAPPRSLTFIRLGTAGSIQPDIEVDSLLVATAAVGMDGLLRYYLPAEHPCFHQPFLQKLMDDSPCHMPALPYFVAADPEWVQHFSPRFQHGIAMTNAGFYAPQGRHLRLPPAQPQWWQYLQQFDFQGNRITHLEMETAAIYGLAALMGHRAVSLNVILANRATGKFSKNVSRQVKRMIQTALELWCTSA